MNIFTQLFQQRPENVEEKKQMILRDLMRREANLSKNIFGPVPNGVKREFFCLDKGTWIWYEEWTDRSGQRMQMTTRYLIRDNEIVKSINGGPYNRLTKEEQRNFKNAVVKYVDTANRELYVSHQHPKGI